MQTRNANPHAIPHTPLAQVEHHLWPQLSALSYQKAQPEVKALCAKHGVPYVQESVWVRLRKTVDIMVGKASMRPYPAAYESEKDMMVWNDQKESENARKCIDNTPPEAMPAAPQLALA